MKNKKITYIIFLLLLIIFHTPLYSQLNNNPSFYIGIGTGLQSYIGGDFGKAYSLRFFSRYNYDDDYYYYDREYYDDNRNIISPLGFDVNAGLKITNYLTLEFETSFIWHFHGWPDRQYETGTIGNLDYIDKFDDSFLFANPYIISLKIYPLSRIFGLYFSTGFGWLYVKEKMDRVREYYDYSYYNYYNYRFTYLIKTYSDSKWCTGFKFAVGLTFPTFEYLSGEIELRYTNFYPDKNLSSPLLINRVPNIGNIALISKFYLSF